MGAVVKLTARKRSKSGSALRGAGAVIAYPGVNMREVAKMFNYIQRRDAEKARLR